MWKRPDVKYPLLLSDLNDTLIFSADFRKKVLISNVVVMCLVVLELFHAVKRDEAFRNFANAPKRNRVTKLDSELQNFEYHVFKPALFIHSKFMPFILQCGLRRLKHLRHSIYGHIPVYLSFLKAVFFPHFLMFSALFFRIKCFSFTLNISKWLVFVGGTQSVLCEMGTEF